MPSDCDLPPLEEPAVDDHALGWRFATGDEAAFEEVVRRYGPAVLRLTRRLMGWHNGPGGSDAEDVAQEALVRIYLRRRTFRGEGSLKSWIARIAINQVRSLHRRKMLTLEVLWRRRPPEASGSALSDARDATRMAIDRLPARDREVVVLHYLEEWPVREVAAVLGVTQNAVMVRLHRARERLATLLGGSEP